MWQESSFETDKRGEEAALFVTARMTKDPLRSQTSDQFNQIAG